MARPKDSDKRLLILAIAKRMFAGKGYERSSMAALARIIGIPVGSLYTYFPSKEALLITIIEEGWNEFSAYLEAGLYYPLPGMSKLAFLVRRALPALFEDMDLIAILLSQASGATKLKEKLDYLASLIASIIGECVREDGGEPKTAIPELEAGLLVMLLGSLESLRLSRRLEMGLGADEIIAFLVSIVEASLGHALPEV